MTEQPRCLFCDHQLDGRSKMFCTACLPPHGEWEDKRGYQARYSLLYAATGRGLLSMARCDLPKSHPAMPPTPQPQPPRRCRYCDTALPKRNYAACDATACRARLEAEKRERGREQMRRQHERKKDDAEYRRKRKLAKYKRLALEHRLKAEMYERLATGETVDRYNPIDIAERDGWRCSLCDKPIDRDAHYTDPQSLSIDHVIPLSKGGTDTLDNLRAAHMGCNAAKGNRPLPNGEQLRLVG